MKKIKTSWLNFILHISAKINKYKESIIDGGILKTLGVALMILLLELLLLIVSLPMYIFISPMSFSRDKGEVEKYRLKRIISLVSVCTFIMIFVITSILSGGIFLAGPVSELRADSLGWSFDNPKDYIYDADKIQIVDGLALFKPEDVAVKSLTEDIENNPSAKEIPLMENGEPSDELPEATTEESEKDPEGESSDKLPEATTEESYKDPDSESTESTSEESDKDPDSESTEATTEESDNKSKTAEDDSAKVTLETTAVEKLTCKAILQPVNSLVVPNTASWDSFVEVSSKNNGEIYYQLSDDNGKTWYYWKNNNWIEAGESDYNIAKEVNEQIKNFPAAAGQILFKAVFTNDCKSEMQLLDIEITFSQEEVETEVQPLKMLQDTGGIVANWSFNENSGSISKDSVGNNNGSVNGADWTSGASGSALDFDGKGGHSEVPNSTSLNISGNQITLACWFKITTVNDDGAFIFKNSQYFLRIDNQGRVCFILYSPSWTEVSMNWGSRIKDTDWHHTAGVYDGTEMKIYLDGKEISSVSNTGYIKPEPSNVWIGSQTGSFNQFNGILDEVQIYNKALSASDVKQLYDSIEPGAAAAQAEEPPAFSSAVITGTTKVGEALSAEGVGYSDVNGDLAATPLYQWTICDTASGTFTNIAGATNNTYMPLAADTGKFIKAIITPTAQTGKSPGATVTSDATAAVSAAEEPPAFSSAVIIGTTKVGEALSAEGVGYSDVNGDLAATPLYQWTICDTASGTFTNIAGATNNTYMPLAADTGKFIKAIITPTAQTGASPGKPMPSPATAAVIKSTLTSSFGYTFTEISGALIKLIKDYYSMYGKFPRSFSPYNFTDIGLVESEWSTARNFIRYSPSGNKLNIRPADGYGFEAVNKSTGKIVRMSYKLKYNFIYYVDEEIWYYHTQDVNNIIDISTFKVYSVETGEIVIELAAPTFLSAEITGSGKVGEVLTATGVGYDDVNGDLAETPLYQWTICDSKDGEYTDISGATGSTYTPVIGDLDKFIKVNVTPVATAEPSTGIPVTSDSVAISPVIPVISEKAGGLVSRWKLDENTGTTANDSAGSNNGFINNALWTTNGVSGSALEFRGNGGLYDYIEIPDSEGLRYTGKFSVSAWVNATDTSSYKYIIDKWWYSGSNNRSWSLNFESGNLIWRGSSNGSDNGEKRVSYPYSAYLNQWTHIAGVYDGKELQLYINGEQVGSQALSNVIPTEKPVFIGTCNRNEKWLFSGVIDEIYYYDKSLSAGDIQEYYNASKPTKEEDKEGVLAAKWTLNENTGTLAADSAGNNNGEIAGASWTTGTSGSALDFNGIDNYISVNNSSNLNPTKALTVSAWIKWDIDPATGKAWAQILSKNGDSQYQLQHNSDNSAFEFAINTTSGRKYLIGKTNVLPNIWYFVVGTYDGSMEKLFVNGNLDASAIISGNLITSAGPLNIGRRSVENDRHFSGKIDEVSMWSRALSSDEVMSLYLEDKNAEDSNVKPIEKPVISNVSAVQDAGADIVKISYDLSTGDSDNVQVVLEISDDSGNTWADPLTGMTGDFGTEITAGSGKTIILDAGIDFEGKENANMRIRLQAASAGQNTSDYAYSPYFALDTKAPFGLDNFKAVSSDSSSIVWSWTPIYSETNFKYYRIIYGQNLEEVQNQTGSALVWDISDDADLSVMGTAGTIITGLSEGIKYYACIWAYDSFGNKTTVSNSYFITKLDQDYSVTIPPFTPILHQPPASTTQPGVLISGISESNSEYDFYVDGEIVIPEFAETKSDGKFTGSITLEEGKHGIYVISIDGNGNSSEPSNIVNVEIVPERENLLVLKDIPNDTEKPGTDKEAAIKDVYQAVESLILQRPQIVDVKGINAGNNILFVGKGIPNSEVVVFIHSEQVIAYKVQVNENGDWSLSHSQNNAELAEGDHEVYALTLDAKSQVKSKISDIKKFQVKVSPLAVFFSYFDLPTTLMTIFILLMGIIVLLVWRGKKAKRILRKQQN